MRICICVFIYIDVEISRRGSEQLSLRLFEALTPHSSNPFLPVEADIVPGEVHYLKLVGSKSGAKAGKLIN